MPFPLYIQITRSNPLNIQTFDIKKLTNNMHKCSMWKLDTNNHIFLQRGPLKEGQRDSRIRYNIQSDIKTPLGKDCEVEKIIKFFKEIKIFFKYYYG